jgi:hypothetical protein
MFERALTEILSFPFEIRFESLFVAGRALSFPCDAAGHVDLDTLPARARHNYLFARSLIGRDFASPVVCARSL